MTAEPVVDTALGDTLRTAFRHYPTGVAVVTASTPGGWAGLTVSSLASVSVDPAVVSFSVATQGRSASLVLAAERLDVHVLPVGRAALARDFATSDGPRFTPEQGWAWSADGPGLADAVATLHCTPRELVPVGPSTLVLADVASLEVSVQAPPLLHHDRRFRALGVEL